MHENRESTWIEHGKVRASPYPADQHAVAHLASSGVTLCINLHERGLKPQWIQNYGLTELHLPVPDFTAPSPAVLAEAVAAIDETIATGAAVSVNCQGGLGRTGTVVAAWLVSQGLSAHDAIALVRARRPGSIETPDQEQAVHEFAEATTSAD